jgi:hypothetical protein
LLRRLLTWFDALRSMRFIHALRDAARPDLALELALQQAPFLPTGTDNSSLIAAERASFGPRGVATALAERLVLGPRPQND